MFKMIRQFTFHHPKQIIAPTLWLFLSQAFSILPAILAKKSPKNSLPP